MKPVVVFDFDGVIHSFTSGWKGVDIVADPPVEGIREAIAEIRKAGYNVVVVSTRCSERSGIYAIRNWLLRWDIVVDNIRSNKPPAVVYIDDRAICFDGDVTGLLDKIKNFKPWYKE